MFFGDWRSQIRCHIGYGIYLNTVAGLTGAKLLPSNAVCEGIYPSGDAEEDKPAPFDSLDSC